VPQFGGRVDEIWKELGRPIWWFSVVAVALLVNILSGYAIRRFDKIGAKYSERKRNELAAIEAKRKRRIEAYASTSETLLLAHFVELRLRIRAMTFISAAGAMAAIIVGLPTEMLGIVGDPIRTMMLLPTTVILLMGIRTFRNSVKTYQEVSEAGRQLYLRREEEDPDIEVDTD
jgi:hypothetical protein